MKKFLIIPLGTMVIFIFYTIGTAQIRIEQKGQYGLERHQLNQLKNISIMIQRGDPINKIKEEFSRFIKNSKVKIKPAPYNGQPVLDRIKQAPDTNQLTGAAVDINQLVAYILRASYQETNEELKFYAEKVERFNKLKKAIRDELTKAREVLANYKKGNTSQKVKIKNITLINEKIRVKKGKVISTKKDIEDYKKKLEEQLSTVGDDAQLANVDLQNMLQKQQQTIQMLSQISKILHDTAMAVIRKIGG